MSSLFVAHLILPHSVAFSPRVEHSTSVIYAPCCFSCARFIVYLVPLIFCIYVDTLCSHSVAYVALRIECLAKLSSQSIAILFTTNYVSFVLVPSGFQLKIEYFSVEPSTIIF